MDDSYNLQVSIPTDDDGFVRQQCPACGREFKAPVEDEELVAPGHCPYCGHQDDSWFTPEQMEQFEAQAMAAVMPELKKELDKMARDVSKSSGGLLSMEVKADEVDAPLMIPEAPDMKVVSSPCCSAVLKLEEDWNGSTFCPKCGDSYNL
jgi:uncharacterized Zn finger protein (UPF0148 family)